MDGPIPSARAAYEALVRSAGLQRPDGRPLHAYRFDKAQFDGVRAVLKREGPRALHGPYSAALFVMFVAEWFRRDRTGGRWDWIAPLAVLGVDYRPSDPRSQVAYSEIRDAAREGLRMWCRPHPKLGSLLLAVVAEAGFPASAIRGNARLAAWLRNSVLSGERGMTIDDAVLAESWRAPETVVQVVAPAAVRLCEAILELRRLSGAVEPNGSEDPVVRLDRTRPTWRAELPFDVEEQDIRSLVEDLVRARASDREGALGVVRRLRREGDVWSCWAGVQLAGVIDQRRLPADLRAELTHSQRFRIAPAGVLREQAKTIAAMERVREEDEERWELRPLVRGFETRLPFGDPLRLVTLQGDRQVTEFTAFAGDPLSDPVVVARTPTPQDLGEAVELEVIGTSSVRSTRSWLALVIRADVFDRVVFGKIFLDLGLTEDGRRVIAFSGRAHLELAGVRLAWRTDAEQDESRRLVLVGKTLRRAKQEVFVGPPEAWILDGEISTRVHRDKLLWRHIGDAQWRSVAEEAPAGHVAFACLREGEVTAATRAHVVPADFNLAADLKRRVVTVSGLIGAKLTARGERELPVRQEGDSAQVDLTSFGAGGDLRLTLRWRSQVEIVLPDPTAQPMLLDPQGRSVTRRRLSLGRLSGYRLLSPNAREICFELRSHDGCQARASRIVDGELPFRAFGDLVRELLGSQTSLDAYVRVTWVGPGDWLAEVGWYDIDQDLVLPESDSPFAAMVELVQPKIMALSLTAPGSGCADEVPRLTPPALRTLLEEQIGPGPWLLLGTTADGRVLRPKPLVDPSPSPSPDGCPLAEALAINSLTKRAKALDELLHAPAGLQESELRLAIDHALLIRRVGAPAVALDLFKSLVRAPVAAVQVLSACSNIDERTAVLGLQEELPLLWCAGPLEAWRAVFTARLDELRRQCAIAGLPGGMAERAVAAALLEIADLQTTLRFHAQGTLLLTGCHSFADPGVTSRLHTQLSASPTELAGQLVARHAESADPPDLSGLSAAASERREVWDGRFDARFYDLQAAPYVTAAMASGRLDYSPELVACCRTAWLFDRDYFEAALISDLLRRAREPAQGPGR